MLQGGEKMMRTTQVRIILATLILAIVISISPISVLSARSFATATTSAKAVTFEKVRSTQIESLKTRAELEIDNRISVLNNALTKLGAAKKLSETSKSTITSQIENYVAILNTLKTKIGSDTDLATLRQDAKSVYSNFKTYAVLLPEIHLLTSADAMMTTADNLSAIVAKLETRIQTAQQGGQDVNNLNKILDDMKSKISSAKLHYTSVQSDALALKAEGLPENKTVIQNMRSKIKAGSADLRSAQQDARQIVNGLKTLEVETTNKAGTSSGSIDDK